MKPAAYRAKHEASQHGERANRQKRRRRKGEEVKGAKVGKWKPQRFVALPRANKETKSTKV
jgi:hypothetical protein